MPTNSYHFSYMLFPLVLAVFIFNLQIKTTFPGIFLFSLVFLFLISGNPSNTASIIVFLIIYLVFFKRRIKESTAKPVFFLIFSCFLILLLCSYIYLPILSVNSNPYGKLAFTQESTISFGFNSINTSFLNLFRLAGVNIWRNFPYYDLYTKNTFFILIGYSIPLLAAISLFIRDGREVKLFFWLIALMAMFFAKGVHPPFQELFLLVAKIPFFGIFRAVYYKFTFFIVISYTAMIGILATQVFSALTKQKRKEKYALLLFPLIILLYNKPFFTGDIIKKEYLSDIPEEYSEVAEIINKDTSDFKIISVPPAPGGRGLLLQWDKNLYVGSHPDMFLLNRPVLDSYWFNAYDLIEGGDSWGDTEFEKNVSSVLNYTGILNAKYIFLHKDFVDYYDFQIGGGYKVFKGKLKSQIIKSILEKQDGIKLVKDSRSYSLYKVPDNYFLPHIYSASTFIVVNANMNALVPITSASYLDSYSYPAIFFTQQQNINNLLSLLSSIKKNLYEQTISVNTNINLNNYINQAISNPLFKKSQKGFDDVLEPKERRYLFFIDKNKTTDIVSETSDHVEIKENPFKLKTDPFHLPKDGYYLVRAYLKPQKTFVPDGIVINRNRTRLITDVTRGWKINPNPDDDNNLSVIDNENGLHIKAYFRKKPGIRKRIILEKEFHNISLKENPYMAFSYMVQGSSVKNINVDIWFKDNNGNMLSKKITLQPANRNYIVNLYEKSLEVFNQRETDILKIGKVRIVFKKKDWIDASVPTVKGNYTFILRNISFLNSQSILVDFNDRVLDFLPDKYYYYDSQGELNEIRFFEEVPHYIKNIYKLKKEKFVDLKDDPVLTVTFPKPILRRGNRRLDFPREFMVLLAVDFDGDKNEDSQVEIVLKPAPRAKKSSNILMNIPALKEIKRRFPDKKYYNLLGLSISCIEDKGAFYQEIINEKLFRYKALNYQLSDFKVDSNVLKIDDKVYKLPENFNKLEKNGQLWIEFKGIKINKGEHKIEAIDNETFKVEIIEIKPEIRQKPEVWADKPPGIKFKKINPTRYVVDVNDAKNSFPLVFSESFHEGWKAYIRQSVPGSQKPDTQGIEPWSALWSAWEDRGNRSEIKEHFVVNGYANGWVVPIKQKSDKEQDFQIILEFLPQRFFETGLLISAITLFGCIGYLGFCLRRQRKKGADEN